MRKPLAAGAAQVDRLVVGDDAALTWEPKFSCKGFQFAGVSRSGPVSVTDVRAVRLQAAVDVVGEFECGDEVLAWVDKATARTVLNNLHGIPTDTPV
ncbi:hypothetical protein [Amycolatopsis sp. FDAARGOS 1241]|uniref:hypothetical protein n=1 Tax=Amycolatopsis sp. FDAARGOS 1241 TaxID=2778070 RepID=UPI001950D236|nr:hypothetical protein [Amycolatopsis sp. FDAARGOS 1241]QRP48476.1 hypothetical protein I6J71_11865 [Amycolatopsis sp. FDAARGOS 1241]